MRYELWKVEFEDAFDDDSTLEPVETKVKTSDDIASLVDEMEVLNEELIKTRKKDDVSYTEYFVVDSTTNLSYHGKEDLL